MAERLEMSVESAKNALKIEKLREYQKSAVIAVLQGKDVFLSQPTGAGKSLVYQMLPFAVEKLLGHEDMFVLVVSSLVSLIRDQTMILKKLGIAYFCLSSDLRFFHDLIINDSLFHVFPSPSSSCMGECFLKKYIQAQQLRQCKPSGGSTR